MFSILDAVCASTVAEVVAAHRCRDAHDGMEFLEWLFSRYDTKLVVLDRAENERDTDEVRDGLLTGVT